jgi:hypothetical protein
MLFPVGPSLEDALSFMVLRVIHHDILRLDEDSMAELIRKKLLMTSTVSTAGASNATRRERRLPGGETDKPLTERLCSKGESFLKRYAPHS